MAKMIKFEWCTDCPHVSKETAFSVTKLRCTKLDLWMNETLFRERCPLPDAPEKEAE